MNTTVKNPYVGPRTFQKEDGAFFYGREREARDLLALISSEKLILFYAQSGAGKSSLLNTRVIPELEQGDFEVLPVGRVLGDLPEGVQIENVYAFNMMNSILQQKTDPKVLANKTISEFLAGLDINDNGYYFDTTRTSGVNQELHWRRVLIIDQFEEIFTTHLDAWLKHGDFFRQVAQALQDDPYLTVILIMRDDYIASLDLYAHLLPGGLRTRYYMQRLTREAALKAVKNPVENIRPFAEGIAEKLVEDLSGILVHKTGGIPEVQSGQYVEPVQLQVVCFSLWQNLPPNGAQITGADLLEVGDVNQSLEVFYNGRVAEVAKEKNFPERLIREWFDNELITANKTRNMILQETESSAGLSNNVIRALQGDLVRGELRAGQIWYELSHDRLIEPVKTSNRKWFEQNLSVFQQRVLLWGQQGRSEGVLLNEQELAQAEKEAEALHITTEERDFLEQSKKQVRRHTRDQVQRRLIFVGFVAAVIALVVAVLFGFSARQASETANAEKLKAEEAQQAQTRLALEANQARDEAVKQAELALAGSLAAQADSVRNSDHSLALLLGMEAFKRDEESLLTRSTLFDLLEFVPYTRLFGYQGPVGSVAVSPDGSVIAASSCREYDNNQCKYGEIILSDAEGQPLGKLEGAYGIANALAFHQYEGVLLLAAGGCVPVDAESQGCTDSKGQLTLWDVADAGAPSLLADTRQNHVNQIKTIAISPDGNLLASGAFDTRVVLWNIENLQQPTMKGSPLTRHSSFVNSLAFSPDGKVLASAGDDQQIILWDVSNPAAVQRIGEALVQHTAAVNGVAFDPQGVKFASVSDDRNVVLWDWDAETKQLQNPNVLGEHGGYVRSVAFSADGSLLASVGFDNKVVLWQADTGAQLGLPLVAHTKPINAVAFGAADGEPFLISGGDDRVAVRWNLSTFNPLSQPVKDASAPSDVGTTALSGDLQAEVVDEQKIRLSGTSTLLTEHTGSIHDLSLGALSGRVLLASASDDLTVIVWDVTDPAGAEPFLKLEGFERPVVAVYFDGDTLVTVEKGLTEEYGRTIRWNIDPSVWLELGCQAANSNLTNDHIQKYMQEQSVINICTVQP
jgi:WD40 repeat protein